MKKLLLILMAYAATNTVFAQADTNNTDTIKVGNYVIVKNNKNLADGDTSNSKKNKKSVNIDIRIGEKKSKNKNISTNWWVFDLGFTNLRDETNYATAQDGSYFQANPGTPKVSASNMNLINNKSSNVNIWVFMQKFNLAKHKLNLKYGLGIEMYNFRYEQSLSYRKDPLNYIKNDDISFSKNKLYAGYLTVPLMLNFTSNPDTKKSFNVSAGISAGYLLNARNKQISSERGKQKIRGNFDLEPFRVAAVAEIGLGPIKLYGSYSLNALHKSSTGLQQYPYALGIRFSN